MRGVGGRAKAMVVFVAFVVVSTGLPALSTAAAGTPGSERGAYEWDNATWSPDPAGYEPTLTALQALDVNTLYVDMTHAVTLVNAHSPDLAPFLADFESLIEEAHADGIAVEAVGGEPTWATTNRTGPAQLLSAMAQVEAALPAGSLHGVQFDVEPWGLHGWHPHRAAYTKDWVRFIGSTVSAWSADGLTGRLGFTVPFWFDAGGAAPRVVFDGRKDYPFELALGLLAALPDTALNVMAYRNFTAGSNGSVALFQSNLDAVTAAGSPTTLLLGQETGNASPPVVTFDGLTCSDFTTAAAQIADAFDGDARYGGIAVDDVESFEALCPG